MDLLEKVQMENLDEEQKMLAELIGLEAFKSLVTDLLEYIPNERKTTGKYLILEEHGNRKQKKEKD